METNLTRNREVVGSIPGLAQGVKDLALPCAVVLSRRRSLDLALLWLWRRWAATAPIRPLAWEPSYAAGAALEKAKGQKKGKDIPSTLGCGFDHGNVLIKQKQAASCSFLTTDPDLNILKGKTYPASPHCFIFIYLLIAF